MQQHPVPKNIIEVEFKLFGAFSLKQFTKIVGGCLVGVLIFLIPVIPIYVKLPFILFSLFIGVGSAVMNNLGTWVNAFVRAIFISPRYVWIKEKSTPDALRRSSTNAVKRNQQMIKAKNTRAVDLTEVPLEKILATRANLGKMHVNDALPITNPAHRQMVEARHDNVSRMISEEFKDLKASEKQTSDQNLISPNQTKVTNSLNTREDYIAEIERLKTELKKMSQIEGDEDMEKQVMDRINKLSSELKLISNMKLSGTGLAGNVTDFRGAPVGGMQNVMGMVVDKKDKSVDKAIITFDDVNSDRVVTAEVSDNGRFVTKEPLAPGTYDVMISHPKKKFHTYRIEVTDGKLPAFKFRER